MTSWLRKLIPSSLKAYGRRKINVIRRNIMAPRMLYGYLDSGGEYRALTRISDTVYFNHPDKIEIGDNVFIGHYSILDGTGGLEIGEGAQLAAWIGVYTHSSHIAIRLYGRHYQEVPEADKKGYLIAPVSIGRYSFIGAGSIILPGVTIGNGALVSAGSVVKKNVGDFEFVGGNPARVLGKTKVLDAKYLPDPTLRKWYEEWDGTANGGK